MSFQCKTCGRLHDDIPFDIAFTRPDAYFSVPEDERDSRIECNLDFCVIDGQQFFIRAFLPIPVHGGTPPNNRFGWGVWVSVNEANFENYVSLADNPVPHGIRYAGSIANEVSEYPDTQKLKCDIFPRQKFRPDIRLHPIDHLFYRDQMAGISLERAIELVSPYVEHQ